MSAETAKDYSFDILQILSDLYYYTEAYNDRLDGIGIMLVQQQNMLQVGSGAQSPVPVAFWLIIYVIRLVIYTISFWS